jgi:hypothetical protein
MPPSPGDLQAAQTADRVTLESDPRWAVVQRLVAGPAFSKSARLSAFLLYVCERAILGRIDEVTEQHVGIHVFDRQPDYNASEDNIVRAHARLLRKKLEDYYAGAGQDDTIRVLIPKGGYLPVFETIHAAEQPAPPARPAPVKRRPKPGWIAAAVLVVAVLAFGGSRWLAPPRPTALVRQFWRHLCNSGQPIVIVPSDTAFVLYQGYTHSSITLSQYLARDFWKQFDVPKDVGAGAILGLGTLPYTNSVDLAFCWRVARKPGLDLGRSLVRPARDLRMVDLKGSNAILIGARRANPWVELFDQNNNFQGLYTLPLADHIVNRAPRASEQPVYRAGTVDGVTRSYALVEFNRGLSSAEHVLILSGLTGPSTEGAADFILNDLALGRFLETITPPHEDVPHFELLLSVDLLNGSAPRTAIVAFRVRQD